MISFEKAFRCDKNNELSACASCKKALRNDNKIKMIISSLSSLKTHHAFIKVTPFTLSIPLNLMFITSYQLITLEPHNDLDTIYKVLKKAGEMSAAAEKNALATTPMKDIPVVNINVPDYPDREPRASGVGGAFSRGPKALPSTKQGLAAPQIADISSSGRVLMINFTLFRFFPYFYLFTLTLSLSLSTPALEHHKMMTNLIFFFFLRNIKNVHSQKSQISYCNTSIYTLKFPLPCHIFYLILIAPRNYYFLFLRMFWGG